MGRVQGRDYYNKAVSGYVSTPFERNERRSLYEHACSQVPAGAKVADIGCGTGHCAGCLAARGFPAHRYWGVDFADEVIAIGRKLYPGWDFEVGDITEPEVTDKFRAFDTFLAVEVLEHISDDIGLLRQIPPGAFVVLSVPNFDDPGHVRWFRDMKAVIARYGKMVAPTRLSGIRADGGAEWFFVAGTRR